VISVGTILHDTYRIEEELGRGGMGRVFAAAHTRLPRRFAVKVLMQAADGQSLRRFKREAEICSQIGHQHIVEVFDFNEVDGTPYIVMELLDGESLRKAFERTPVPARTFAIQLVQEVGKALGAAHAAGVVHRDLKPENIFICREDGQQKFKVLDFGISKIIGARSLQTREDMLLGTPGYMSPEQARGDVQSVSERADQFALASIVYEALSGHAAFVAPEDTPYTVLYKIVHREPAPLFGQSAEVQRVLARALAKQPEDRYQNVGEFTEAMVGALLRVPETTATARPRVGRRRRHRTWTLLLAAAVAVGAVGATTALVVQRVRAQRADRVAAAHALEIAAKPAVTTARQPAMPAGTATPQPDTATPRPAANVGAPVVAAPKSVAEPVAAPAPEKVDPLRLPKPSQTHIDKAAATRPLRPIKKPVPKPVAHEADDELSNPYAPDKR
jgi:serine/threonine-protein kinase